MDEIRVNDVRLTAYQYAMSGLPTEIKSIDGFIIESEEMDVEEALANLRALTTCRCDEAWTARGKHDPNAACDYAVEVEVLAKALEDPDTRY